ncbi:aldo/keto reductase [Lactobacillus crispatus]|jgi:hypothetical protein|uniref:aldo/keto reductase n=1 Tax=Lactobacillus crispatus TaxID=47770 RepID=UPI0018AB09BB
MTEIPTIKLNDGNEMPQFGFGVFQIPDHDEAVKTVEMALANGYRLIDTAEAYNNQKAVGEGMKNSGVDRSDIFLTTKLWVSNFSYEKAKTAIDNDLEELGTDYIDLILLHQAYGDVYGAWRAMEEVLCFGWIDTTHKRINGVDMQRFTPRSKRSQWSELNKERCRRLEKLGLMTKAERKELPDMSEDAFKIDPDIKAAFDENLIAWENFQKFPKLYQRVRIDSIQRNKKKDQAVFDKRLKKLIEQSEKNKMFGQWNNYGRLLEY